MAITKPPVKKAIPAIEAVDSFISGAPDAQHSDTPKKPKYVKKGNKLQITLTISPSILERVDALAEKLGQSRAAVINLAIYQGLESGLSVNKSSE